MNGEDTFHTVRTGDTLWDLANRFGTTVEQLQAWNKIRDPNKIKIGQRLLVSKAESEAESAG
ncbi:MULTISPECIES: LysM peptidoglycan-binding domain-containing protein [Streptomyces]|uniref:LysM domain-containing protein n=1 Tax=Streptomyces osmaniensis TaxID=593134 RepID=A0ABP6XY40_9ACTN|nr:LysM domain-containing protein [Streptomyces sp. AC550_RSS872]QWA25109.1 LysM peptidoglycan-binding domain-containing protein [Streptomyces sp. JCM17656]